LFVYTKTASEVNSGSSLCLTKYHAMKAYPVLNYTPRHSAVMAPQIFNLGIRWRWLVSFKPRPFYPEEKSPWYPLDRKQGGVQIQYGRGGRESKSGRPATNSLTILTELPRVTKA
jgi:hypothetical protein